MKREKSIVMLGLCLAAGMVCACNRTGENKLLPLPTVVPVQAGKETAAPTSMATAAVTPELTVLPTVTAAPEEDLLPITEEYFSDTTFRTYLSEKYDCDKDGFLSGAERNVVREIVWDYFELEAAGIILDREDVSGAVLDGFEYFPNLEHLTVTSAEEVVFKDHPSIRGIGGVEGGVGLIRAENCPALISIGGNMYSGDIDVKDCENMELFWAHESVFDSVSFIGTPKLVVCIEVSEIEKIQLDADAVISSGEYGLGRGRGSLVFTENGEIGLDYGGVIEWKKRTKEALDVTKDFFENCLLEEDFSYMDIRLLEKVENIYDEQGRKGWNVCVDLMKDAYSKTAFSLYTEEQPTVEQIAIRPVEVIWVEILEYSPNRGVSFEIAMNFEVLYRNGETEEVLGTLSDEQYWTITPDGEKIRYQSEKDWWRNGSW